jgi:hypothetical protein
MAITLKRQLTDSEKNEIIERHGRVCFATGHEIAEGQTLQFDHIRAFDTQGPSELHNIAPMCETHNKAKGRLPLEDFRVKLRLDSFFEQGDSLTLKHLLAYLKEQGDISGYGQSIVVKDSASEILIETSDGKRRNYTLYKCPTTGWQYFYATLPVELLDSDDEDNGKVGLQPRFLIQDKVFELFRHFQIHPVLQPSIGRVQNGQVLLFDGQHKTAALLWTGRREFECKVYLDPNIRLLNQTNISAHDKFSQTRFYSSIMVIKLGKEFGADFETYKNIEDDSVKSEAGFMKYQDRDPAQAMTKGERNKRFRSYLYNSVLEDSENRVSRFVSNGNRGSDEKPLTTDMLNKSIFASFLFKEPVDDNMATDAYKRDKEISNNVALMNMLYDLALGSWNPKAGPNDGNQRRLVRLFRSKSIMAWSEILRDAVRGKLDLQDEEERARPFYRDLSVDDLDRIKKMVERLVNWKLWSSPPNSEIDRIMADNKSEVKDWFRDKGLTTGYLMGANE